MKASQSISKPAAITTPNDTEIRIERTFDAPRDLVFRAYTDAKLLPQWMGPRKYKMKIEQMDIRPGGRWRFLHIDTDGTEYGFHGEFREIVRPERIVQTWNFEGMPGESIQTALFQENHGRTTVTSIVKFERKEHRDGMLASGMESGLNEGYDRLDELLRTMH
ncbi:hypothetical protein E6H37_04105 [Candidatus Bathyarchaeota archaeon]|nr:MAG: hypothetical protein E6H37_04105 [Candidatus Bathyarchaeota archaeon]